LDRVVPAISQKHKADIARAQRDRKAKTYQALMEKRLKRSEIPKCFVGKGFDDYEVSYPAQQNALDVCKRYAAKFEEIRKEGTGLVLVGNPSTGKSHLACAVLQAVMSKGGTGMFLTVSEMLRMLRSGYNAKTEYSHAEVFDILTSQDLLALDEVGMPTDGNPEKAKTLVFDVINRRLQELRPVILLGNVNAEEIERHLGERVWSRMRRTKSPVISFTWKGKA